MKNTPLFLALLMGLSSVATNANNTEPESKDPWVASYRQIERSSFLAEDEESGGTIAFFNDFSVGASAGLGLFHGSLADYDIFAPLGDFDTYYNFAWRVYAMKQFKPGIGVKLQFEKGQLTGGRTPGEQSLPIDFETKYNTISAVATFDIFNEVFNKGKDLDDYKFYLFAEVGVGLTLYRSFSTWRPVGTQVGEIRDYVGYSVVDDDQPTQRYLLKAKESPEMTLNIPVGFTFGYRINYKTDITFNYTLNNTSTKELDTFSREFNSNDKYSYFGVGLRYNFNREKSQYPKKKEKEPKAEKDKKWSLFGSKKEDVEPSDVALETPIESRKSNKIDPSQSNNADLEEIRMKMFELQLKLFEMQYLLNGGEGEEGAPTKPESK